MQVGSSVSSRYYTQYHNSSSVKKRAGTSIFEGVYSSNETINNQRSSETVDYQEFYKVWMSHGATAVREYTNSNVIVKPMEQTGAVSIAKTEEEGEFLGLTMVPEEGQSVTYGMRAMLSVQSTPDNPIVQVVSNLGGKKVIYNVEVNKVNPNSATQLEVYGGNAGSIGYCGSLSGADVFLNDKFDWTSIMQKMVQIYMEAGIENQAENNEVKENTTIDFSRFAPNAPEEVRKAFSEAAEETGYYEYSGKGKMNYISQILVSQVENRQNGVANYMDVFGSTAASALQAARHMLYDLENPLMPNSQRSEDVIKYREQEEEMQFLL